MNIFKCIFNFIKKIMSSNNFTNSNNTTHIEIKQDNNSGNIKNNINQDKDKK